jgi:phthalate 4,5-cis-dihydrodiol dehydrogenase
MPFVGLTMVSCERGVMRQSPQGIYLSTDEGREELAAPPYQGPRRRADRASRRAGGRTRRLPNGEWGKTNLEICPGDFEKAHAKAGTSPSETLLTPRAA